MSTARTSRTAPPSRSRKSPSHASWRAGPRPRRVQIITKRPGGSARHFPAAPRLRPDGRAVAEVVEDAKGRAGARHHKGTPPRGASESAQPPPAGPQADAVGPRLQRVRGRDARLLCPRRPRPPARGASLGRARRGAPPPPPPPPSPSPSKTSTAATPSARGPWRPGAGGVRVHGSTRGRAGARRVAGEGCRGAPRPRTRPRRPRARRWRGAAAPRPGRAAAGRRRASRLHRTPRREQAGCTCSPCAVASQACFG